MAELYLIMNLKQFQINSIFFHFDFPCICYMGGFAELSQQNFQATRKAQKVMALKLNLNSPNTDSEDLLHCTHGFMSTET